MRLGARHADLMALGFQRLAQTRLAYYGRDSLALAIVARASARGESLAVALARDVERTPGGRRSAAAYRGAAEHAQRRDFFTLPARRAADGLPADRLERVVLGYWLQTGRIAARRGDRDFFARPESRAVAAGAPTLGGLRPSARRALADVEARVAALATPAPPADAAAAEADALPDDLAALEGALHRALEALAR